MIGASAEVGARVWIMIGIRSPTVTEFKTNSFQLSAKIWYQKKGPGKTKMAGII